MKTRLEGNRLVIRDQPLGFWLFYSFFVAGGVIYSAFLRTIYFFVSTDSGFGGGDFRKRVVGEGVIFHRDKVTSECRAGRVTQLRLWIKASASMGEAILG